MILVEGFIHVDGLYPTVTGTNSFVVLFTLVHASSLLVELVLLKGIPGITE